MSFIRALFRTVGILGVGGAISSSFAAGPVTNLAWFATSNGSHPSGPLIQGADGAFYGTTELGGTGGATGPGTVYKVTSAGALSVVAFFNRTNGANPDAGLTIGPNGSFYGVTAAGGTNGFGSFFNVATNGGLTSLFAFGGTNGSTPEGTLALGADGSFYGTTSLGGASNVGTIFKVSPAGAFTSLYTFYGTNGANPYGALTPAPGGGFYGTTSAGGSGGYGTVFKVTTNGSLTTIASFDGTLGATPYAGVIVGADGNLYGTTSAGSSLGYGNVFKVTTNGLSELVPFDSANGATPYAGLTIGYDGNFYGVTELGGLNNDGTVFQMTPAGSLTTLMSFSFSTSGNLPIGTLLRSADGNMYGTVHNGGTKAAGGVFRLNLPPPPPFLLSQSIAGNQVNFVWGVVPGLTYQAQWTPQLSPTNWQNFGASFTASNTTAVISDSVTLSQQRYYRMALVLP